MADPPTSRQSWPLQAAIHSVNPLLAAAGRVATELDRLGVPHALVGGLAVSARTEPRFTQDLDIAVAVADDLAAERTVRELASSGYTATTLVEHDTAERLATVRLASPTGTEIVDLLFASSGIEPEITAAAEVLVIAPGLRLPIARTGHLIALKLLARDDDTRPQDLVDLRALLTVADASDQELLIEAITQIHQRGFNRGRDLRAELEKLNL
jgi:predicted nucleotidyltransferase